MVGLPTTASWPTWALNGIGSRLLVGQGGRLELGVRVRGLVIAMVLITG